MIAKSVVGKSFKGCVNYNLDKVENGMGKILECRGVRQDRKLMIKDFNSGRYANSKLTRTVWHSSLSFQEEFQDEMKLEIAKEWMAGLGLDKTQYVVLTHTDTKHPHVHIIANRIADDGTTISDSNNWKRSEAICKQIISKYNLTPVPEIRNERKINRDKLHGRDLLKTDVNRALSKILPQAKDLLDFCNRMEKVGIDCELLFDEKELFKGVIFKRDSLRLKASDLNIMSHNLISTLLRMGSDKKIDQHQVRGMNI